MAATKATTVEQRKGASTKMQSCCRDRGNHVRAWVLRGKESSMASARKLKIQKLPLKGLEANAILALHCFIASLACSTMLTGVVWPTWVRVQTKDSWDKGTDTVSSRREAHHPTKAASALTIHRGPDLLCIRHSARLKSSGQGRPSGSISPTTNTVQK